MSRENGATSAFGTGPSVGLFNGLPAKHPSLVLLKEKEHEKDKGKFTTTVYYGEFNRYCIAHFVSLNKLPLVATFTQKTVSSLQGHPIHKLIILVAAANEHPESLADFKKVAKLFEGKKLLFVFVDKNNEEHKQAAKNFFRINYTGREIEVFAYTKEDNMIIPLDSMVSPKNIEEFAQKFLDDKLYLSETPDVKIVVGDNVEQIVLDESKDVLLVLYDPNVLWKSPTAACSTLAKYLRDVDSLVIAKMDRTANWHPRAKDKGMTNYFSNPKVLFYPAEKKRDLDPITFEEKEKTVKGLYKFIKKHADKKTLDRINQLEKKEKEKMKELISEDEE